MNHLPLHLGERKLDLVEPGRVGRREVAVDLGMRSARNSSTRLVVCVERSRMTWISSSQESEYGIMMHPDQLSLDAPDSVVNSSSHLAITCAVAKFSSM